VKGTGIFVTPEELAQAIIDHSLPRESTYIVAQAYLDLKQSVEYHVTESLKELEQIRQEYEQLYKAAQAVVDIWKQTSSFIRVNPILANLAAKLEELEGGA